MTERELGYGPLMAMEVTFEDDEVALKLRNASDALRCCELSTTGGDGGNETGEEVAELLLGENSCARRSFSSPGDGSIDGICALESMLSFCEK